jgi:hypothetical protein
MYAVLLVVFRADYSNTILAVHCLLLPRSRKQPKQFACASVEYMPYASIPLYINTISLLA